MDEDIPKLGQDIGTDAVKYLDEFGHTKDLFV